MLSLTRQVNATSASNMFVDDEWKKFIGPNDQALMMTSKTK